MSAKWLTNILEALYRTMQYLNCNNEVSVMLSYHCLVIAESPIILRFSSANETIECTTQKNKGDVLKHSNDPLQSDPPSEIIKLLDIGNGRVELQPNACIILPDNFCTSVHVKNGLIESIFLWFINIFFWFWKVQILYVDETTYKMVHKLRNRDVCQSSPRSNQMQSRLTKTFMGNIGHSTPKHNKILRQRNVLSKRSVLVNMSNVGQDSTIRLNQVEGGTSDNLSATFNNLNISKSQIKLHNIIDGYIFSHTFGKKSGVSLYAVKKSLREEQPYNSYRTSKQVSRYIAFSIKTGKFQQITGKGAAGTFRLNRSIHIGHLETLRRLRKVSLQSHTIQRQKSNRQAKHNTVL